jgi:putative endonuclease
MSFWRRPESRGGVVKLYYVYILASKRKGTFYTGVTDDLIRRVYEHKNNLVEGFTRKYGVHMLVYYEQCESVESAIRREKQLKAWHRDWEVRLVEETNPDWIDLYYELIQ